MIVEQIAPAGPTAWLAAVGLAHLTKEPLDAVEVALLASDGKQVPSVPSRWVKTGTAWSLEIDGTPADFDALLGWYAARFDTWRTGGETGNGRTAGRDPWWRTRGNTNVDGIGRALYAELATIKTPVDVARELAGRAGTLPTDKAAGWVIDRQWVTLETDEQPMRRPLIRYALAYVGATVAQWWPGHMVGRLAVGHLWDGQPGDHPLGGHVAITWEPVQDRTGHYPPWWGAGEYVTIPAATWANQVRDRWMDYWVRSEILGRTEASRIWPGRLPSPHLTRGAGPLWRRSLLELQAAERQLTAKETPRHQAKAPGAPEAGAQPLDIAGVAEHTGLSVATLRGYVRDKTMPKPDGTMGQSAWWWSSTIDTWQDARPTPGRPRKPQEEDDRDER